jgi:hypothetical protein
VRQYALAKVFGAGPRRTPSHFRFKTDGPRHDRAWWVRIDRIGSPVRLAEVDARLAEGSVRIGTTNVRALSVLPGQMPGRATELQVDGQRVPLPAGAFEAEAVRLQYRRGRWRPAAADEEALLKRKGLSGPVSDALRDPFLLVYGTAGESDLHRQVSLAEARRFAQNWALRYGEGPRMKADKDVEPADIARFNLVLFGSPAVNSLAAQVLPGTPARVTDDGVLLGGELYRGSNVGLIMCYPNPLNRERLAVVVAGTTPAALYQAFDRTGLWFNWGVYDKYKWFDYGVYDARTVGPESFLTVGFFDNEWALAPKGDTAAGGGAEWRGTPVARVPLSPQGFPRLRSPVENKAVRVPLTDIMPLETEQYRLDQYRGAVGFDRSYSGIPIWVGGRSFARGLGVKAPSEISFPLARQFSRFSAEVGLTNGFKGKPTPARVASELVSFQILGDGQVLATSPRLGWQPETPRMHTFAVDVTDVNVLTLKVVPAGRNTWLYGAAVWADPELRR